MIDLERVIDLGSDGRVSDVFQTVVENPGREDGSIRKWFPEIL